MSLTILTLFLSCLGIKRKPDRHIAVEKSTLEAKYTDGEPHDAELEASASRFVAILLHANATKPQDPELQKALKDTISTYGYHDRVAQYILQKLEKALKKGAALGKALKEASERATAEAVGFAKEHPAYCTLVALGILVVMAPWVLEIFGFAELGPVEGKPILRQDSPEVYSFRRTELTRCKVLSQLCGRHAMRATFLKVPYSLSFSGWGWSGIEAAVHGRLNLRRARFSRSMARLGA